jgi:hypothetical protein
MFGNKRTKQEVVIINSAFGKMKYEWGCWKLCDEIKMILWDTAYNTDCYVMVETEEEEINEKQEIAWEKFNTMIVRQKKQIEEIIMKYFECDDAGDSSNRFVPEDIFFSKNGECALFAKDAEETDYDDLGAGFAIFLVPKLMLYSPEDCLDYIYGHPNSFIDKKLYGDEENS